MTSPYHVLGLPQNASQQDIRQRFRQLAKQSHPDHHPDDPTSAERFKEVAAAYALLMGKVEASSSSHSSVLRWDHAVLWALWTCSPVR